MGPLVNKINLRRNYVLKQVLGSSRLLPVGAAGCGTAAAAGRDEAAAAAAALARAEVSK